MVNHHRKRARFVSVCRCRLRERPSARVVNVVPGDRVVAEYLVRHDGVDKIAFTGSTTAGRRIEELCAAALKLNRHAPLRI
ncbi:aldehyde dehydrogenase family protein [Nocardia aurea]|uniref:aldehyde dehydrogenase family protein n=1 Tax=Nocardia aurea TaxID=2144174 RepID=UPI001E597A3C|nr:aldehyde dehydrogenase family protein [Nocardia aurea]